MLFRSALALAISGATASRTGSDNRAVQVANELKPGYQPWAQPMGWVPSSDAERLLFALQAGLGGGLLGFAAARQRKGTGKQN